MMNTSILADSVWLAFADGSELTLHPRDPWATALVALAHEVVDRRVP